LEIYTWGLLHILCIVPQQPTKKNFHGGSSGN
jgi:hypothetical protein